MKTNVQVLCESYNNANTYVVSKGKECIIIDPANDVRFVKKMVGENKVQGIFLTHGHYDHFKELENTLKEYDVKCYMHKNALEKLSDIDKSYARAFRCLNPLILDRNKVVFVSEGETIKFDHLEIKILYKPGHTDCSIVLIIDNLMFTGDLLFKQSVGRTDLYSGSVVAINRSLQEIKKMDKKGNYLIYPGHDDSTTLRDEIKANRFLFDV